MSVNLTDLALEPLPVFDFDSTEKAVDMNAQAEFETFMSEFELLQKTLNDLAELDEMLPKLIMDDLAMELFETAGYMESLNLTEQDLQRSLDGRKDIVESSMEGMVKDTVQKILKWLKSFLKWCLAKSKSTMSTMAYYLTGKVGNDPMVVVNVERFYSTYKTVLDASSVKLEITPIDDINTILQEVTQIVDVANKIDPASGTSVFLVEDVDKYVSNAIDSFKKSSINISMGKTVNDLNITFDTKKNIVTRTGWTNKDGVVNVIKRMDSLSKEINSTIVKIDKDIEIVKKKKRPSNITSIVDLNVLKAEGLVLAKMQKIFDQIVLEFRRSYKLVYDFATKGKADRSAKNKH